MSILQNNPKDVDLSTISTLDSIFEMEQFVVILDENSIPWKVVEHDDILLKSYSGNIGHSTLLVETGKEKESLKLLKKFRQKQAEGKECSECGLWLGPMIKVCPACKTEVK